MTYCTIKSLQNECTLLYVGGSFLRSMVIVVLFIYLFIILPFFVCLPQHNTQFTAIHMSLDLPLGTKTNRKPPHTNRYGKPNLSILSRTNLIDLI